MLCPEMEFVGRIAVRMGLCQTRNTRFALFPDFLIPRRRVSRLGHQNLRSAHRRHPGKILNVIDECLEGLGDEFYLPRSTARACVIGPPE